MTGVGAPCEAIWGAHRRGKREEAQVGGRQGGTVGGGSVAAALSVLLVSACYTWEESRRKEKRGKRKEEGKEKKKWKKIPNMEIFEKIKDNLWSWSKIIFIKESICLIINK
jgi:hypothetical protein